MNDSANPSNPAKPVKPAKTVVRNSFGIKVLFAILIVWCLLIAIGSYQMQVSTANQKVDGAMAERQFDYRRPLIVVGTMSVFLGVWALALRSKSRRD